MTGLGEIATMEEVHNGADTVYLDTPPDSRRRIVMRVDAHEIGAAIEVPVHVLAGRTAGPCAAFVAGVHGDEYDGILAMHRLLAGVAPAQLAGTLIVIPVANSSAFGAGQRHTPIDGADLNRVFPGRVDGSVTERLAHQLCHDVLRHMDLVFTLHGARSPNRLMEWIEFLDEPGRLGAASRAAAMASGFANLIASAQARLSVGCTGRVRCTRGGSRDGGPGRSARSQRGVICRARRRHPSPSRHDCPGERAARSRPVGLA